MSQLSPWTILGIIVIYFLFLIFLSWWTSRKHNDNNENFFLAGRQAPWYLVAFGMIGASLSGVTFISIPGFVGSGEPKIAAFSYMQMVFGYLLGYAVIALILIPLYYRLQLTSIYTYLDQRFGNNAYKTGAAYFLISRIIGASFRLYLVAMVLQLFVTGPFGIPFEITVAVTILLIWIYTFRGGIKTIVWTDALQTTCMLLAVIFTIYFIGQELDRGVGELVTLVQQSDFSKVFFFRSGWEDPNNFFKLFVSGALIAIVMTGLDQDMMQKNLSIRTRRESQINIATFSIILVFVNLLFLTLGALLFIYANQIGLEIPEKTDQLYPMIALQHLPAVAGVVFIIGLIAAAYSSADSALTALTTSFCVDFLGFEKSDQKEEEKKRTRIKVHIGFSIVLLITIIAFNILNNEAVVKQIFVFAGYTYGPLLGLFAFGMLTNLQVRNNLVIPICIAAPILSYILNAYDLFVGFELGFLIILLNGLLTFLGLWAISYRDE